MLLLSYYYGYLIQLYQDQPIKPPPLMFSWEFFEPFTTAILKNTSEQLLLQLPLDLSFCVLTLDFV